MTSINHGDSIVLKASPLHIQGFTSYVKTFYNLMCLHWQREIERPDDALVFIVGDRTRAGQPIKTNEVVNLVTEEGKGPLLLGNNIYYNESWTQQASTSFQIVFTCDGIPDGTPLQATMPYWINFASHRWASWGLPSSGMMLNLVIDFNAHKTCFMLEQVQKASCVSISPALTSIIESGANPMNIPIPESVYYTIDDCCSEYTDSTVDFINQNKLPVLWFINGSASSMTPALRKSLENICASPYCMVGIHTWDHRNMSSQLSLAEVNQQIADTIKLVEDAHRAVGKKWDYARLFRFPFTDPGRGLKYQELQQVLRNFSFVRHEPIQTCLFRNGLDISGLFIEDGLYKTSSKREFMDHLKERFTMFQTNFSAFFNKTLVFGTHDTKHCVTTLKFMMDNGVKFLDPRVL